MVEERELTAGDLDEICSYWHDIETDRELTCDQQLLFFKQDTLVATSGYRRGGYFHWFYGGPSVLMCLFPWWWASPRGGHQGCVSKADR